MEMEKILYTNMWDEGKEATATYIPNSETPYYYGYEENPNFVGYELSLIHILMGKFV